MFRTILLAFTLALALPAAAQDRRPSHCFAIAQNIPGAAYIQKASWQTPTADEFTVRISYIDHSMYLIQTHGGIDAVTDYNGFIGAVGLVPDVVTMNNAHGTHWTVAPHPDIPHVLEGWKQQGVPADHYLDLGEMLIRNATTDVRNGFGDRYEDNNSIFIFEAAGLCIGHLGHLHHEPSEETYAAIGRLDVVMAAVDGGTTVDTPTMIRIVKRLRSSIVLPMHWWSGGSLNAFLAGVSDEFLVEQPGTSSMELSLRDLPSRPTVVVLQPKFLTEDE
ncbi:MAG: MBL fold metallo-hydrolase [Silicimonas sp.]|jgi:L-ascorbate metabolism protein UlaG (beta-lactamase superfamily)|nr:MBL fold metallo-hydrolase [Silicimonas sp.]